MDTCEFTFGRWEDLISGVKDETVGLVYTDPPYGMNYVSNIPGSKEWNKSQKTNSKFDKPIMNDKHGDIDFNNFAKEMYRVMKPDTYIVIHCNIEWIVENALCFLDNGFTLKGMIAWDKRFAIGGDINGSMKRDGEPILYMAKGKPKLRPVKIKREGQVVVRKRISEFGSDWIFQLPKEERSGFPTQKPKALCTQVITMMSDAGDIVLDPFSGSGTIAKSAARLGRRFISFEADKDVFAKFLSEKINILPPPISLIATINDI